MPGLARAGGSLLGAGLNKAFGDNPDLPGRVPAPSLNINTPAFSLQTSPQGDSGARISLTRTDPFGINRLRGLIDEVRPGFGRFTDAAVNAVSRSRERTLGALRSDLARRRVLGSSFGANTLALAEQSFADQEAEVTANALLREIQTSSALIQQELSDNLAALGVASNLGASIAQGLQAAGLEQFRTQVQDVFARRAGSAKFFGDLGQDIAGSKEATEFSENQNSNGGGSGMTSLAAMFFGGG